MIFNNLKDNEQFEASGYIKSYFLNTHELETLKKAYSAYISMDGGVIDFAKNLGYYISVFDSNIEKRKFINTILKELFTPKIEQLLNGYKILYGNFLDSPKDQLHGKGFTYCDEILNDTDYDRSNIKINDFDAVIHGSYHIYGEKYEVDHPKNRLQTLSKEGALRQVEGDFGAADLRFGADQSLGQSGQWQQKGSGHIGCGKPTHLA